MTCSKVMKNSDTGGFRGQTGHGHESGENAHRRNSNGSGTSHLTPLSPPLKPKLGQSNNNNNINGKAKSAPEKEKVYGYIDLFKNMGDSLPLRMFPLTLTSVTIGRDASCQIRIHNNARVSRHQCSIIVVPGQDKKSEDVKITLQNLTSRPTTVHKNRGLAPGEIVHLSHGDRFRLYDVELRWRIYDPVNEKGQLDWSRPIPVIRLNPPQDSNRPPPVLAPAPISIPPVMTTTNTKTIPVNIAAGKNSVNRPVVKITKASPVSTNSWMNNMNKSIIEQRRKSSPLPMSSSAKQQANSYSNSKMDLLKIPKWSSMRLANNNNTNNNNQNNKTLEKNQRNNNNNNNEENSKNLANLNVMNSYDKRRASTGNYQQSFNYNKRRGSADIDMRKAVLQRSFRRAFKERTLMLSQGSNIIEGVQGGQGQPEIIQSSRYRRALEDLIVLSSAA